MSEEVKRHLAGGRGERLEQFGYAGVYGFSLMGYAGAGQDFVGQVDREVAVFHDERKEV
jgi:hypothetical protein